MRGGVTERAHTPKRSQSADGYLRETRIGAVVALLLVAVAVTTDFLDERFWAKHAIITGIVASLLVVVISAGVFNEVVERRDRRRWAVLAQYVMFDLVQTARACWTGLLDLSGLSVSDQTPAAALADARALVADTVQLRQAVVALIADPQRREILQRAVAAAAAHCDEVLGNWAGVMLSATAYVEVIDRHVELYSRIAWVNGLLGHYEPIDDDPRRRRLSRASPAVEVLQDFDDDMLCDMTVSIVVLAESLDRKTLPIALNLVPLDWWQARSYDATAAASHA